MVKAVNRKVLLGSCILAALISGCESDNTASENQSNTSEAISIAPGAPGDTPTWAFSGKTGIGTSYEAYVNGQFSDEAVTGVVSKVWFSIAEGVLTETMWGLIHEAQLKDLQFAIVGDGFVDYEISATSNTQNYLFKDSQGRPLSPAYQLINRDLDGQYTIEKHLFTDPSRQALWQRSIITANMDGLTPVLIANPHIANTGTGDFGVATTQGLSFSDGNSHMHVAFSVAPVTTSVGFHGSSGAYTDLQDGKLDWAYQATGNTAGNIIGSAAFKPLNKNEKLRVDIVLGFGSTEAQAREQATTSLAQGYEPVLGAYNGSGDNIGWQDYMASLTDLPALNQQAADGGALAHASALVLKIQEDKTHAGALIASLSNPWGDTVPADKPATGYKAVWPRDFYQCAMAFLAMGDAATAKVAFEYLEKIQVGGDKHGNKGAGGWFYQKAEVDGTPEWVAVQLDQVGMPIMLGWQLWQQGHLTTQELAEHYAHVLKPAAEFLVTGGEVSIDWNTTTIEPPRTQQERWEEQMGYSPSTTAAVIAGLVSAADIAGALGFDADSQRFLVAADKYYEVIDAAMYTTAGQFPGHPEYYLRATQNRDPNDNAKLQDRNGRGELNELDIIDGGFLELVRYGVKAPSNPKILNSLAVLDDTNLPNPVRTHYQFTDASGQVFSGWRRYGHDGYGEDITNGANYGSGGVAGFVGHTMSPGQRGRVWPFLTGERAHYEIAAGANADDIRTRYIGALEYFANPGLMLPEQVWDGVGEAGSRNYQLGDGNNSATPLAWAHAEYLKLLRSTQEGRVFDSYPPVVERYQAQ